MTVDMNTKSHATGFPADTLAQHYGAHILNVVAKTDTDNGNIVGVGAMASQNTYTEATPATFTGEIVGKTADGKWLVNVTAAENAGLVYTEPLTPYETPSVLTLEESLYNKAGDIMRVYMLAPYDRIAVSEDGFSATPAAGKKVTGVSAKKLTVATA